MREYNDNHEAPNIDIQYVALRGWAVRLPQGVEGMKQEKRVKDSNLFLFQNLFITLL